MFPKDLVFLQEVTVSPFRSPDTRRPKCRLTIIHALKLKEKIQGGKRQTRK